MRTFSPTEPNTGPIGRSGEIWLPLDPRVRSTLISESIATRREPIAPPASLAPDALDPVAEPLSVVEKSGGRLAGGIVAVTMVGP
ncbi:hypothetical protein M2163_000651 [Streptomyces sp. SAI-135]|uniref:hypothetical protein n=1 Tax=unclassified Streptomyces TaxID=2593676 RepID=UPI002474F267|nr:MULTISPECIES: hypothetical protein [unclassified Streptomyces]MDH6522842.1 hypothetical protein [Streptomyces sp. SAI-090]MDH6573729.1 hypothetical protein [Streptomyces sp. SAI-117]MDH6613543.1 hypothetical protein [Streptomyces sp. SAI-135]